MLGEFDTQKPIYDNVLVVKPTINKQETAEIYTFNQIKDYINIYIWQTEGKYSQVVLKLLSK